MPRAVWKGVTIAESPRTVVVEGNHYFPPETVNDELLRETPATTICPWKGKASYYDIVLEHDVNASAAWTYRHPSPLARRIRNHVAFWNGVEIESLPGDERRGLRRLFHRSRA